MTDWNPRTNGTLRGFLIVLAVAAALTAAGQAGAIGISVVFLVLQITFAVVIAIFLFRLWRQNREEIATWPRRVRVVFYGGAALAVANIVASLLTAYPSSGLEALVFFFVLAACIFSMWRAWRDQHTYGYA